MSKFDENLEKAKSAVKSTAQKVQNSDIADKAKTSVKNVSQKIQENEAVNKMKEATGNAVQKAKENENVANAVDKINQNEYVQQAKKSKNYKYIKIGAIALAVILVVGICTMCFGNSLNDKDAKAAMESYIFNTNVESAKVGATNNVTALSIKTVDSYKAKSKQSGLSSEVFILDVKYTIDDKDKKLICGVYKEGEEDFHCTLQNSYDAGSGNSRDDSIKSIKNNLDILFE